MIAKELPDKLPEFIRKLRILLLYSICLIDRLPVPLLVSFINVLIQWVALNCLMQKRHHPSDHYEQNDPNGKYVGSVSLVRFALVNFRSHVPLSAHVRVINSDHASLSESLCKGEIAHLQVEISVDQYVFKFEVTMYNAELHMQILNNRK